MPASEHLHPTLFHGTGAFLPEGGVIEPRNENLLFKGKVAFASTNMDEAKQYAYPHTRTRLFAPVHEVEPVDPTEENLSQRNPQWHVSNKGFRVKKTHYVYWND